MAVAALGVMVAGAAVSAYGSISAGQQQKKALQQQAGLDQYSAQVAAATGEANAREAEYQGNLLRGAQQEAGGAGGVAGSGSILDQVSEGARRTAWNAAALRFRGLSESYASNLKAANELRTGRYAAQAGITQGFTTLLTAGGGAYFARQGGVVPPANVSLSGESGGF